MEPSEDHQNLHGGRLHQETQIKWKHLNLVQFGSFNLACHLIVDLAVYPSDLLRTRMQLQSHINPQMNSVFPVYRNTLHGFRTILKTEGLKGLYRGFLFGEFGWAATTFFNFVTYEYLKERLQEWIPTSNKTQVFTTTFLAGGIASSLGIVFTVPAEIIQQRIQLQGSLLQHSKPTHVSPMTVVKNLYSQYGLYSLYRGCGACIVRDGLSSATWWSSYELTKFFLHDNDPRVLLGLHHRKSPEFFGSGVENEDPFIQITAAMIAAVCMAVVANPVDVVKTRLQTQDMVNKEIHLHHRSTLTLCLELFRKEGPKVYFKGLTPSLIAGIPHSLIGVLIYEYSKKLCLKVPE